MNLRDNINRIFDMNFPENWGERREASQWRPAVDIFEKDDEMVVHAELPGVKKDGVLEVRVPGSQSKEMRRISIE